MLMAYGGTKTDPKPITGFVFRDNLIRHNQYGVHGSDRAVGQDTLDAFFPGAVFESNTIAGGDSSRYPKGNTLHRRGRFQRGVPRCRRRGLPAQTRQPPARRRRRMAATSAPTSSRLRQALGLRPRPAPAAERQV